MYSSKQAAALTLINLTTDDDASFHESEKNERGGSDNGQDYV